MLRLEFIFACNSLQTASPGYFPSLMGEVENFQSHQAKLPAHRIDQPGLPVLQAPGLLARGVQQQHVAQPAPALECLVVDAFK
ncbi:hypothetical protein D3C75_1031530 [compost metagenome]